ncbi:MAG: hypothetical protein AB7F86_18380, partial [Bdellovibrionales bacterium]
YSMGLSRITVGSVSLFLLTYWSAPSAFALSKKVNLRDGSYEVISSQMVTGGEAPLEARCEGLDRLVRGSCYTPHQVPDFNRNGMNRDGLGGYDLGHDSLDRFGLGDSTAASKALFVDEGQLSGDLQGWSCTLKNKPFNNQLLLVTKAKCKKSEATQVTSPEG